MSKVVLDMAMSLDGFIAGPLGEDHGLHDYFFSPSSVIAGIVQEGLNTTGTIIIGRRAYEIGAAQQDGYADDPYQVPTFVLTHHVPDKIAKGAESFIFVTDGIESALEQAKAVTGDKAVVVGGGANIAQQYLNAGLFDEIKIYLVPILIGAGIRLFDHLDKGLFELEKIKVVDAPDVTHLVYRVVK
jgi:dihydrofolate reductase